MSLPKYGEYKESGAKWLGRVPAHWFVVQSRRYFTNRNEKALSGDKQLTASQKHGVVYQADFMEMEGQKVMQVIVGADILKHAEPNDFVISMRSFQGGIEWCGLRGSISSAYVMLVPNEAIWSPFYRFLFKSTLYIQALQATTNLVRDGQALRFSNFAQVPLPLPPVKEQQSIAAFLDRETAKIDALIAEKEKLIALLAEKRLVTISHAVTKGLNPNAPMKDSGVAWLGDVPAHWRVLRLRFIVDIETGNADTANATDEGEFPFFVRSQTVERMGKYTHDCEAVLTAGDGAGVGKVFHHFTGKFCAHQRVYIFKDFRGVSGKWFFEYLRALFYCVVLEGTAKSTVDSLRRPMIADFPVTIPSAGEMTAIERHITLESSKFERLIQEAELGVDLLKERRTALIAAAVTGQIDVRSEMSQAAAASAEAIAA